MSIDRVIWETKEYIIHLHCGWFYVLSTFLVNLLVIELQNLLIKLDHAKYLHASVPKLYINSLEEVVGKASRCINVTARGSIAAVAR